MPIELPHKITKGTGAEIRRSIRALENVGQTPGGIQYRTQTGAQAELPLPTATNYTLGNDGIKPAWVPIVTATQAATATQPVDSFLYAVTASASQILISWASVATQYCHFQIDLYGFQTATSAQIAGRFSTDGITIDTATNSNFWTTLAFWNRATPSMSVYGATSQNSASQLMLTGTDYGIAVGFQLNGHIDVWPSAANNTLPPNIEWSVTFLSTDVANQTLVRTLGSAHYWPMVDIQGLALFPVVGAASFTAGIARLYGRV